MKKVKVAIIGCGAIAHATHIPNYMTNEDVEIKYFCDIIEERAVGAVEKYGCGKAVLDYHDFLNDPELDAVSVCTHNDLHSVISIDFMKAGKDVLSEKPVARNLSEAFEMQKVAHETGRLLIIGVVNRFGTAVNKVRELIQEGVLGEVYHVYASFRGFRSIPGLGGPFTTKAHSGGGVLIDIGVHYIDLIMYCCGEPNPLTASGQAFSKIGVDVKKYLTPGRMWAEETSDRDGIFDVDDSVIGVIRTDGPVISVNGAWAQNIGIGESFIDFMGTKGGIRLQYCKNFKLFTEQNGMLLESEPSYPTEDFAKVEIDSFVKCVQTGVPNQATVDNVIKTAKILQAIYDSTDAKKEIMID